MPIKIVPLTHGQMTEYFKVYRDAFPDWSVEQDFTLTRSNGPVKQMIAFESLRSGSYRPSCSIQVSGPPSGGVLLFRYLDIKHREVLPRQHASVWPLVIHAMEEQFLPFVRKPLDIAEVLDIGEQAIVVDNITNIRNFSALAALSTYVERVENAVKWCDRVESQLAKN